MKKGILLFYFTVFFLYSVCGYAIDKNLNNKMSDSTASPINSNENVQENFPDDPFGSEGNEDPIKEFLEIPDPFESYNRFMFAFNDKLYFYFLKPTAKGYKKIIPEFVRTKIGNFYKNVKMPGRLFNCLFQGKGEEAAKEFERFTINSTFGFGGFFDVAGSYFKLEPADEDSEQTLGSYGMGPGFYVVNPFYGPSSFRGCIGLLFDSLLNPLNYIHIFADPFILPSLEFHERVNFTSFHIGEYENFKRNSLAPYAALRDAYFQNIQSKIKR
ncbi:MAG: VacJ family lipoprotein [Thermodesulfobacteriota bacterium]|nr:VacJ family lipoprotein [Thermodesulfobacteriota bacterium]